MHPLTERAALCPFFSCVMLWPLTPYLPVQLQMSAWDYLNFNIQSNSVSVPPTSSPNAQPNAGSRNVQADAWQLLELGMAGTCTVLSECACQLWFLAVRALKPACLESPRLPMAWRQARHQPNAWRIVCLPCNRCSKCIHLARWPIHCTSVSCRTHANW